MTNLYGSLEVYGTKFICVVADEGSNTVGETTISTNDSQETLKKIMIFLLNLKI